MALFCPLYSGSSGNCVYLDSGKTKVLIDLGVSCRAAVTALSSLDVDPKDLSAILITHEHSDHIKGLAVFLKKYPVPLFASREVLDFIQENVKLPEDLPLYEADPDGFYVDQMQVSPFPTSHDSVGSLGYRFTFLDKHNDEISVGVATDLGVYTPQVQQGLCGCQVVMLESNYDEGMIRVSDYPYYLKRRIQSQNGHLSNGDCANALTGLAAQGTRHFVLGHLSKNNNMELLAHQAAHQALSQAGFVEDRDFTLQVARRSEPSIPILLSDSPDAPVANLLLKPGWTAAAAPSPAL